MKISYIIIYIYVYMMRGKSIIIQLKHKFIDGSDSISNHLLKYAATPLSKPLMVIINQMLTNGFFQEKLKLA